MPLAPVRWRWRTAACAATRAAGPSTCAPGRSAASEGARASEAAGDGRKRERAEAGGTSKNARRRVVELEREVERAETALRKLEDELADPSRWSSPALTGESTERHARAKRAVEEAYARWEQASATTGSVES